MKNNSFNASKLRITMISVIIVIIGITSTGFYFAQQFLQKFASDVRQSNLRAKADNISPVEVNALKTKISDLGSTITKTENIAIPSQNYQDQAIRDLNKYATESGLAINGSFNFSRPTSIGLSTQLSSGAIRTEPVVITLANPVEFSSFIKFLKLIETNLPKMQLTGINISRDQNINSAITTDPLTIEVYTK